MSSTDFLCGFLAGATIGIAGTILCAPAPGRETRQTAKSGAQAVRERATNLQQQAGDVLDSGSQVIDRAKQEVTDAVNAGKQTFVEARTLKTATANP